jgi:hypothetical protein
LEDDTPFVIGQESIMDIPINQQGYAGIYIDNATGVTVGLPSTRNTDQLEAAIPLVIEVAANQMTKRNQSPMS